MGAADYPLAPSLSEELPILSKLQDYGYAEDTETPILLAPILESMGTKGLWLLERLVSDLADFSDSTQCLKDTISELTAQLEQEKQTTQHLKTESLRLCDENARMRMKIEQLEGKELVPKSSGRAEEEEEQLRQWRTQSLHQLQELERMNQALRAALSRHTCAAPTLTTASSTETVAGKEKPCGGYIVLSQVLDPSGTACSTVTETKALNLEQKNHTNRRRVSETCQEMTEDDVEKGKEENFNMEMLLMETQEELSAKNQEIERLSSLVEASAKMLQTVNEKSKEKEEAKPSKENSDKISSMDKKMMEDLQLKLESVHKTLQEKECIIAGLRSQLAQKVEELSFITDEKVVGEEALTASQLECKQLSSLIKELDERMAQLQSALETKTGECVATFVVEKQELDERISQLQLALQTRTRERDAAFVAEKQVTEAKQLVEESFQKKHDDLLSDLQVLKEKHGASQQERDECKKKEEESRLKCTQSLADLQNCQKRLELAERDVQELKGLITQLDLTREELVEKLKMTMAERLVLEDQVASLEMELCRLAEENNLRNNEIRQLHTLLEAISKERDRVHAEMQLQLERVSQLNDENNRMITEVKGLRNSVENAERKLQTETQLLQKSELEVQSLKERLSVEESSRKTAEDRCALKAVELENLAEHLNSMTSDFKLVKTQLVTAVSERENLVEDLKNLTTRLNYSEQVICAKEEEEKVMANSYDELVEEHQQLKLAAIELDSQVQQQTFQLHNTEELLKTTQDHSSFLEEECHKLKDDLKEMEKQLEMLSRSLAQQASLLDNMQREKTTLISQLSSSKQTTLELESRNTTLIRELAATESNNQLLTSMIQGKIQEAESFASRYRLEHERVRELEQLLACFRAQEHQLQLESKDSGAKSAILKERLLALEEQVRLLQRCKDSQKEEIVRLSTLLKEKNEEESRRISSLHAHTHAHDGLLIHEFHDCTDSKTKLQELEMKTMSLAADLSKTAALYKDCFSRLQKAEAQCAEQRSEYDHVLSILSKVDDDRLQLQQRCRQLVSVAGNSRLASADGKLESIAEQPETEDGN